MASQSEISNVISDFLNEEGLVSHLIDSFDDFVQHGISSTLNELVEIVSENDERVHIIRVINVVIEAPVFANSNGIIEDLTLRSSRLRGLSLNSNVKVDAIHDIINKSDSKIEQRKIFKNVHMASVPVMLGSMLYPVSNVKDAGFFVVNGNDKTIVSQAKLIPNKPLIFESCGLAYKNKEFVCEVRSLNESKLRSTSTIYIYCNKLSSGTLPKISVELPFLHGEVSLLTLFRIVGCEIEVKDIVSKFFQSDVDKQISCLVKLILFNDAYKFKTYNEAFDHICRYCTKETVPEKQALYVSHIVNNEVFPHCGLDGSESTKIRKQIFLRDCVIKLIGVVIGIGSVDDRDDLLNKRIDQAGAMLSLLFRQLVRNSVRAAGTALKKIVDAKKREFSFEACDLLVFKKVTAGLRYAMSTGNWGVSRTGSSTSNGQIGVVQIISRLNGISGLASIRRINTPLAREGRAAGPRQLNSSTFGYVCASETPEGVACGLITNLALTAQIRVCTPARPLREAVLFLGATPIDQIGDSIPQKNIVYVNGVPFAVSVEEDISIFANKMRLRRRQGNFAFNVGIYIFQNNLYINSENGALVRPLIIKENYDTFLKTISEYKKISFVGIWKELVKRGCVEYVEYAEQLNLKVALWYGDADETTSHVELHPSLSISGLVLSCTPFANSNPGPRNAYQAAQGKQSIGIYDFDFMLRFEHQSQILISPQRPLAATLVDELLPTSSSRAGALPIVAIVSLDGFNQEDSICLTKSSIERGLFHSLYYTIFQDEERVIGADVEVYENPLEIKGIFGLKNANYKKIGKDGLPLIGSRMTNNDILIGKTVATSSIELNPTKNEVRRSTKRCRSVQYKGDEGAVVDAVFKSITKEGKLFLKIRMKSFRAPVVGDKFSSKFPLASPPLPFFSQT